MNKLTDETLLSSQVGCMGKKKRYSSFKQRKKEKSMQALFCIFFLKSMQNEMISHERF